MGLSVGIVGLPNVGKSTIFNALTRAQNAESANYPFCTIEPNKASVPVPDKRVDQLAQLAHPRRTLNATVDFVDIAGLVKGASQGEGLGNKFLTNIRETDAILHVVRCFDDENITHVDGSIDPLRDIGVIETELILADYQMVEKRIERMRKQARADKAIRGMLEFSEKLLLHLGEGRPALAFDAKESELGQQFYRESLLLTDKKIIYCANVDEDGLLEGNAYIDAVQAHADKEGCDLVKICAAMEEQMNDLEDDERQEFLDEYAVTESGLDQIIRTGYHTLGLISYLTCGPKEVRAWTIHRGWKAPKAAGVIHSDFERGFIRAQVIAFDEYIKHEGEAGAKAAGVMRLEGKDYEMQDGDVVEFLFNV